MVTTLAASSATPVSLPPVSDLRKTPPGELVPGTSRPELDPKEGFDPKYVAYALALQEAGLGVFRHLPDEDRKQAEAIYDTRQPSTVEGRVEKLALLHRFRDLNTERAVATVA